LFYLIFLFLKRLEKNSKTFLRPGNWPKNRGCNKYRACLDQEEMFLYVITVEQDYRLWFLNIANAIYLFTIL